MCVLVATSASCAADSAEGLGVTSSSVSDTVSDSASHPANGEQVTVVALDNNFLRETTEVVAGTEVLFTNNGRNPHNVVPADDPTASTWGVLEADFMPEDTYARVFDTPGTYVYYCTIHGSAKAGMVGTIVVTAP